MMLGSTSPISAASSHMPEAFVIDLNDWIDGQKVQRSTIVFLVIATLATIGDGFDISAMGFVVPQLTVAWGKAPAQFAPVFTAGIFGMLFGGPLLGFVGDRFGRKKAMLAALCTYGVFTLVTMAATSLNQFIVLRFLTGLGLGGMIPNIMALTAELAPKRLRGMFIIIVLFGVPAGFAFPGLIAARFVPHYGWQVLLLVGGVLPLLIALVSVFLVHESLRFLVQRGGSDNEIARIARALRPDLVIDSPARFSSATRGTKAGGSSSPARLFAGGLAVITPTLWIALAANQFANFFILSWLPIMLQSVGLSTAQAGVSASMFSIGGLAGGLVLILIIDRFGILPIVALFILGAPLAAAMGISGVTPAALMVIIAGAGFCVTGNNYGLNSALALIYPTPVRSLGTGWGQALGRLGSLAAPVIGGILLGMHIPMRTVYFAPACALVIGAVAAGFLAVLCIRRFAGYRLDDMSAAERSTT